MFANGVLFSEPRDPQRSTWQRNWLCGLLLVALVFIAYTRVFNAGFIWDDESHLTKNPCIIGPLGLKEIWTSTRAVYYPLVLTTFWTLHKFVGLNPVPYHVLNVLMHAGSAVLLWRVSRQLNIRGAWLGAALWALHPITVQSVAWVTELKNTQSCLFYLLSIFCFLKWQEQPRMTRITRVADIRKQTGALSKAPQRRLRNCRWLVSAARQRRFALSLVFFILATVSKPSTVMLPVVLALCVWWRRGRIQWGDVAALAPLALISVVASVWTIWEQKFHAGASGQEWAQTWPERLIIAGRAIWFYLGKLIWPHPLIFIYPRWEINSSQLIAYLPLLAALTGLLALWLTRAKWSRSVFFAAAYYAVSLFPVLGFFSVFFFRYSFVSDHFQYLASMGPLALAGAGIVTAVEKIGVHRLAIQAASPLVILSILGALSFHQSAKYYDVIALYQATLAQNPGCWMAEYNLGLALKNQGQLDQAIAHYRRAINIWPDYVEAHYNLGGAYIEKGEFDEALAEYRRAIEIHPNEADSHNNYGSALRELKQFDQAEIEYKRALSLRPQYLDARLNLGSLLLQRGRTAEAIANLETARRLQPNDATTHVTLALALMKNGQTGEAAAELNRALQLAPDKVSALNSLAWVLATAADDSVRDGKRAVQLAERAN